MLKCLPGGLWVSGSSPACWHLWFNTLASHDGQGKCSFRHMFALDYNDSPSANVMCLPRFWFYSHPQIGNYLSCSNFQEASAKVYLHMTMDPISSSYNSSSLSNSPFRWLKSILRTSLLTSTSTAACSSQVRTLLNLCHFSLNHKTKAWHRLCHMVYP